MVDGGLQVDFGRGVARPGSATGGGGGGLGEAAWGARKRAAAARGDRRDELCSLRLAVLRGKRREESNGKLRGARVAKSGAQTPRSGAIADAWRLAAIQTPTPVWASQEKHYSGTVIAFRDFDSISVN